jgi:hypothetical protein
MLAILLAEEPNFFSKAFKADIADEIPLIMAILLFSKDKKPILLHERMGFSIESFTGWATPLSAVGEPEALRPTLSRGLPFSQLLYSNIGTEPKKL